MDNDENNHHEDPGIEAWIDPAWETRIVALLQGEASDFESEDLEKQMRENPELRVFHRRMLAVHGLLGEAHREGASETAPMLLSSERRAAVLERIRASAKEEKTEKPKGPKAMNVVALECPKAAEQRRKKAWAWALTSAAAVFVSLFMLAGLLFRRPGSEFMAAAPMDRAFASGPEADSSPNSRMSGRDYLQNPGAKPVAPTPVTQPAFTQPVGYRTETVRESLAVPEADDAPTAALPTLGAGFGKGFGSDDGTQLAQNSDGHFSEDERRFAIPGGLSDEAKVRMFAAMDGKASGGDGIASDPAAAPEDAFHKAKSDTSLLASAPESEEIPPAGTLFRQDQEGRGGRSGEERPELARPAEVTDGWEKDTVRSMVTSRIRKATTLAEGGGAGRFSWASQPGAITTFRTKEQYDEYEAAALEKYKMNLSDQAPADGEKMGEDAVALFDSRSGRKELSERDEVTRGIELGKSGEMAEADRLRDLGRNYFELGDFAQAEKHLEAALGVDGTDELARQQLAEVERSRESWNRFSRDETRAKMLGEVDELWEADAPSGPLADPVASNAPADGGEQIPLETNAPEATVAANSAGSMSVDDFGLESGFKTALGTVLGDDANGSVDGRTMDDTTALYSRFGRPGEPETEGKRENAISEDALQGETVRLARGSESDWSDKDLSDRLASSSGGLGGGGAAGATEDVPLAITGQYVDAGGAAEERMTATAAGAGAGQVEIQSAAIDGPLDQLGLAGLGGDVPAKMSAQQQGQESESREENLSLDTGLVASPTPALSVTNEATGIDLSVTPEAVDFEGFIANAPTEEAEVSGVAEDELRFGAIVAPQSGPEMPSNGPGTASLTSGTGGGGGVPSADGTMTEDGVNLGFDVGVGDDSKYVFPGVDSRGEGQGIPAEAASHWAFTTPEVEENGRLSKLRSDIETVRGFSYPTEFNPPEIPLEFAARQNGGATFGFPVTPSSPTSFEIENLEGVSANFAKGFLGGEEVSTPEVVVNGRVSGEWSESVASLGEEIVEATKGRSLESLTKVIEEASVEESAKPGDAVAEDTPVPDPVPVAEPVAPVEAQPEIETAVEPTSTFSLHVSDVSFKLAEAALLGSGEWPAAGKMRIEEFVNAFDYGDPAPSQEEAVACRTEQAAHPFLPQRNLLRVAMRTGATGRASDQPLRLTILLDKSGSMERDDREASVERAMEALASHLTANDSVTLIGFARQPHLLADRLPGERANELAGMVARAPSEGGTNLEEALKLAEAKAKEQFVEGGQNRIVLLTDGAANLGDARPESLGERVVNLRQQGIGFDACGVGADGLNDAILEALTRQGDGRYYFLNRPSDADENFVRQLAGALRPAAKNVKVQVIFNPERVTRYRLLGFEKFLLKKEDFRNDAVDAAEMAAAEAGVGLYEMAVDPSGQGDVGEVSVRFQDMATGEMVERSWTIPYDAEAAALDEATPSMQLAGTAAFLGMKLRGGPDAGMVRFGDLGNVTSDLRAHYSESPRVQRLLQMVEKVRGGE